MRRCLGIDDISSGYDCGSDIREFTAPASVLKSRHRGRFLLLTLLQAVDGETGQNSLEDAGGAVAGRRFGVGDGWAAARKYHRSGSREP